MQRPGAGAAQQKGIAKLCLASGRIGEIAERSVERFDAGGGASVNHLRSRVVPEILLKGGAGSITAVIGKHLVVGMAAADTGRLHGPRRREIGRAEAHTVHPWRR